MATMKIVPSVCFWLLAIMPTLVMSEDKIPSEIKIFGELFLTEEESSVYAKLEAWVFEEAVEDAEMIRRIGVAKVLLDRSVYVNQRSLDNERWVDPFIAKIDAGYFYVEGIDSELDPNAPSEFELHTRKLRRQPSAWKTHNICNVP